MIGCQSHMFRTPKYRGALRREGCTSSPKLCGHKWGATYSMLETYFESVGETIELIVRANEWRDFGDQHSFTPSERSELLQLKK